MSVNPNEKINDDHSATLALNDLCGGGKTLLPLTQKTGNEGPRFTEDCVTVTWKRHCTSNPSGFKAYEHNR